MTANKLPEDTTHYWAWRVHVVAELIQHVLYETKAGRLFVEELDTSNFDELFELAVRGAGVDTAGGWAARSSNRR